MESKIRTMLIEAARAYKPITYKEIAEEVGLNLELIDQRNILSALLGTISEKEHEEGRPLISAMAMYSNLEGHGDGFYNLCEGLDIGSKQQLKQDNYAFKAMKKNHDYWANQPITAPTRHPIEMFTPDDLNFFNRLHKGDKRLSNNNEATKERVKKLFEKTNYWAKKTAEGILDYSEDNRWQISGYFKNYSWAKLYDATHLDKCIFFTFSVGDNNTLIYKLDAARSASLKQHLDTTQIERFDYLIEGTDARWREVQADKLLHLSWDDLIRMSRNFVLRHLALYYNSIAYAWNNSIQGNSISLVETLPPNTLTKKKKTSFAHQYNEYKDIDFLSEHAANIKIGNEGEELVIEYEKSKLIAANLESLADQVRKMPDGAGYDIHSYEVDGSELNIEVKSTLGSKDQPFYISANELDFIKEYSEKARIYRIYNLKPKEKTASFFILNWDELQNYNCQPTSFKISI